MALGAVACGGGGERSASNAPPTPTRSGGIPAEPTAGRWKTWVLGAPDQIEVPPPPEAGSAEAEAEEAELGALPGERTAEELATIHRYSDHPAIEPWTRLNMELVAEQSKNPPLASRGYGLVSVAMYDAVVAAYHWKYTYRRDPPTGTRPAVPAGADPSYPSEHAAMAGAATRVLAYLFPERTEASYDQLAEEAADSRVAAGTNWPSDVDAGLALGRAVADAVIAHAKTDGSDRHWEGTPPTGAGLWQPPPDAPAGGTQPVEPLAGRWRTWVAKVEDVRVGPPPAYGSEQFLTEAQEVLEVGRNLTEEQKKVATFWAGGKGTPLPPGIWNQIALDQVRARPLSIPRVARTFALMNAAQADAGVAAWDCKYAYWSPRPVNAIRDLGLDPTWTPFLPTPVFPSYISGHSTYSSAAAEVLAYLFPDNAERFRSQAAEAAVSRLYGGIHYRTDNEVGLHVGTEIGRLVVERAGNDGAGETKVAARLRPTPATGGASAGPTTTLAPRPAEERSQPYWVPLVTLEGQGSQTTEPFTVEDAALQWRLTWKCTGDAFRAVVVPEGGAAERRPLADARTCAQDGKAFSTTTGRFTLQVTSSRPWQLIVEQQIDRPLVEPPPPTISAPGASLVGTAQLYDVDRTGRGTAKVYRLADGSHLVRLEDFFVSANSDLEIRFSPLASPRTTDEIAAAPFDQVAFLKATAGAMNYAVPAGVDPTRFGAIVIWCEITRNAYAAGAMQPA